MTITYPDVVKYIIALVPEHINSFILDSELVAYDLHNEKILPF